MDENNKKDKNEDPEIQELEDQLEELLKEASKGENNAQMSFKIDSTTINKVFSKNFVIDCLLKILFSFLLVFTINYFIPFFKGDILYFALFAGASVIVDYIINTILEKKIFLLNLLTGGLVDGVVTALIFLIIGAVMINIFDMRFLGFGFILLDFIIFIVLRNFVYKYFNLNLIKI